jgi:hypothetical protein
LKLKTVPKEKGYYAAWKLSNIPFSLPEISGLVKLYTEIYGISRGIDAKIGNTIYYGVKKGS